MFNSKIPLLKNLRSSYKKILILLILGSLGIFGVLYLKGSSIRNQMSKGDRILVNERNSTSKQIAAQAVQQQDDDIAIKDFENILKTDRNDPESLIYLNNLKAKKASDNNFSIGVSVPIDVNPNVAQEMLRGVAQAQDEVNLAGGIGGKRMIVTIATDRNDPKLAVQIAQEFAKDDSILAVVGHNASEASLAAAQIYQEKGIVMISPTSSSNKLTGFGSYIFRTIPGTRVFADLLSKHVIGLQKKRVGLCQDSRAGDSIAFRDDFIASFVGEGGQIIPLNCEMSDPNFDPQAILQLAQLDKIEVLLICPHIDHLDLALRLAKINQGRIPLISSSTLYTAQVLAGKDDVKGLVIPVFWHKDLNPNFSKDAIRYWSGNVNWRTATSYDATRSILKAISLSANPTRSSIQSNLRSGSFSVVGSTGEVRFMDTGDRLGKPVLMTIQSSAKGYEFVPLITNNVSNSASTEKTNEIK